MRKYLKGIAVAIMLMMSVLVAGCADEHVDVVKEGYMRAYPGITVGYAFDNFFKDGTWESFESEDHQRIVEFNGGATMMNKPVDVKVQFIVEGKNFRYHTTAINDKPAPNIIALALMDTVFEKAGQK